MKHYRFGGGFRYVRRFGDCVDPCGDDVIEGFKFLDQPRSAFWTDPVNFFEYRQLYVVFSKTLIKGRREAVRLVTYLLEYPESP